MTEIRTEGGAYDPQREQVRKLRQSGCSCDEIVRQAGLPKDTVLACLGELGFPIEGPVGLAEKEPCRGGVKCLYCGEELKQPWTGRRKKFCSRVCKDRWYYRRNNRACLQVKGKLKETECVQPDGDARQPQTAKLRVAAYIRVSTDRASQQDSFEIQERYFRKLLKKHSDWESAGVYADYGSSGTTVRKRVGLTRLLRRCREGRIDRIITKSISRFTRNTGDFLNTLNMLKAQGVTVFFEKENLDTADAASEFILTALGAAAQEESRSISENIRWGFQKKCRMGEAKNVAVYGYRYGDSASVKTGRQVEPEEAQAAVVRRIFREFTDGVSYAEIARRLNREHIAAPEPEHGARAKRKRGGRPPERGELYDSVVRGWTPAQVAAVVRQERYAGDVLLQKTYIADYLTHKAVRNHGERRWYSVKQHHPAIVDSGQFEQAQLAAGQKTQGRPKALKEKTEKHCFSGLFVCGGCGRFYTVRNRKHRPIWYCPSGFPDTCGGICRGKQLYEKQAADVIQRAVYDRFLAENASAWEQVRVEDVFAGRYIASEADGRAQKSDLFLQRMRRQLECMQEKEDEAETAALNEAFSYGHSGAKSDEAEWVRRGEALAWLCTLPEGTAGMRLFLHGVTAKYAKAFFLYIRVEHPEKCTVCWFDGVCGDIKLPDGTEEFWI